MGSRISRKKSVGMCTDETSKYVPPTVPPPPLHIIHEDGGHDHSDEAAPENDEENVIPEKIGHGPDAKIYGHAPISDDWRELSQVKTTEYAREVVERCWQTIEKQSVNTDVARNNKLDESSTPSKFATIRVFVSSTFTDFHSEREVLAKLVFPQLKTWCSENGLTLIETDLRWGVPKDTIAKDTIRLCLEELARCSEHSAGKPFFVNLMGERYGWIPRKEDVSEDIQQQFNWVPNVSITHMEILNGAYRTSNPNALFLLRNDSILESIPEDHLPAFVDQHPLAVEHLKVLKQKLAKQFKDSKQYHAYETAFDKIDNSTGRDLVKLANLEEFGNIVRQFLEDRIRVEYRVRNAAAKSEEAESDGDIETGDYMQEYFIAESIQCFVGRAEELQLMERYIVADDVTSAPNVVRCSLEMPLEQTKNSSPHEFGECPWALDSQAKVNPILWVSGAAGAGKTSLAARFCCNLVQKYPEIVVFKNFPTADESLSDEYNIVTRLNRLAHTRVPATTDKAHRHEAEMKLWKTEGVPALSKLGQTVVLILVGLDKMESKNSPSALHWLPPVFPDNVFCIVTSGTDHRPTTFRIEARGALQLMLEALTINDQETFVRTYLGRFNKQLDNGQMSSLLRESRSPIWLSLALEELRLFGDFESLSKRIDALHADIDELIWNDIILRKKQDDPYDCIEKQEESTWRIIILSILKLLALVNCTYRNSGLPEAGLKILLGNIDANEPVSDFIWTTTRTSLGKLIRIRPDSFVFVGNNTVESVIRKKLLTSEEAEFEYHVLLAKYFDKHCPETYYHLAVSSLPYHLVRSKQPEAVVNFFYRDPRGRVATVEERRSRLNEIKCKTVVFEASRDADKIKGQICVFCKPVVQGHETCYICNLPMPQLNAVVLCMKHTNAHMPTCLLCRKNVMAKGIANDAKVCIFCKTSGNNQCGYLGN